MGNTSTGTSKREIKDQDLSHPTITQNPITETLPHKDIKQENSLNLFNYSNAQNLQHNINEPKYKESDPYYSNSNEHGFSLIHAIAKAMIKYINIQNWRDENKNLILLNTESIIYSLLNQLPKLQASNIELMNVLDWNATRGYFSNQKGKIYYYQIKITKTSLLQEISPDIAWVDLRFLFPEYKNFKSAQGHSMFIEYSKIKKIQISQKQNINSNNPESQQIFIVKNSWGSFHEKCEINHDLAHLQLYTLQIIEFKTLDIIKTNQIIYC